MRPAPPLHSAKGAVTVAISTSSSALFVPASPTKREFGGAISRASDTSEFTDAAFFERPRTLSARTSLSMAIEHDHAVATVLEWFGRMAPHQQTTFVEELLQKCHPRELTLLSSVLRPMAHFYEHLTGYASAARGGGAGGAGGPVHGGADSAWTPATEAEDSQESRARALHMLHQSPPLCRKRGGVLPSIDVHGGSPMRGERSLHHGHHVTTHHTHTSSPSSPMRPGKSSHGRGNLPALGHASPRDARDHGAHHVSFLGGEEEAAVEWLPVETEADMRRFRQRIEDVLEWFGGRSQIQRAKFLSTLIRDCRPRQIRQAFHTVKTLLHRDFVSFLPPALALRILSHLPATDLCKAACASRRWREVSEENDIWRKKCAEVGFMPANEKEFRIAVGDGGRWKTFYIIRYKDKLAKTFRGDFLLLPPKLSLQILSYLDPVSLRGAAVVSRTWNAGVEALRAMRRREKFAREVAENDAWRRRCMESGWVAEPIEDTAAAAKYSWRDRYAFRQRLERNMDAGKYLQGGFEGHSGAVVALQTNGSIVVSASEDGTARIWDLRSGLCLRTLQGHTAGLCCIQMREKRLVSGSLDMSIKVWDIDTGTCKQTLRGHKGSVRCLQFTRRRLVTGSSDGDCRVWDMRSGRCKLTIPVESEVLSLHFVSKVLITGSADGILRIFALTDGVCLQTLDDGYPIHALKIDGTYVFCTSDTAVSVWNIEEGIKEAVIGNGECAHSAPITNMLISPTHLSRVVTIARDGLIKEWDTQTGTCVRTHPQRNSSVLALLLLDTMFITGGEDCRVDIMNYEI